MVAASSRRRGGRLQMCVHGAARRANPLASNAKEKKIESKRRKEKRKHSYGNLRPEKECRILCCGKETHSSIFLYLKCKYTYDKASCLQFVFSSENPQSFKWGRGIYFFVLRLFLSFPSFSPSSVFVGYSWLGKISICLPGARKPAQIFASCWAKAQLNPCKPNVYPMWK